VSGALLCYVHINKNSGNTVRDVLRRNYPGRLYESLLGRRTSTLTGDPVTVDAPDVPVRELVEAARRAQGIVDCLAVNLPYGIHRRLDRPVRYFTLLREPVQRCVSYWYWAHHRQGPLWRAFEAMDRDLSRILADARFPQFRNDQTRFITGTASAEVTWDDLDRAKDLIGTEYAFVGAVERFADSHRMLADRLGWADRRYAHLNHADRADAALLPAAATRLFREHNEIDSELHRWLLDVYLPRVLEAR
jgi:hypothetical protein